MTASHDITISRPIYNRHVCQVVCSCGDFLEEHPSPGKAAMAGLGHVRAATEPIREETSA